MLERTQTIAALVLDHSECAEIFQRHHIDFCCRGNQSIETAAAGKGIDAEVLLEELSQAIADRKNQPGQDLRELSTADLIKHIVSTHHDYLREALPFIHSLATKVGRVHGDRNPKLRDLAVAVEQLRTALITHLDDEEQSLFPALLVEKTDTAKLAKHFASIHEEHLQVADLLDRARAATDEFSLPDWACNSYRTLFSELEALEHDVFTHVHLETHMLMPRFAEQRAELSTEHETH